MDLSTEVEEGASRRIPTDNDRVRATQLSHLAHLHFQRFKERDSLPDLNESIDLLEQALTITPAGQTSHTMYINSLIDGLHKRFTRTMSMNDLRRAIALSRMLADSTNNEAHQKAIYLINLSNLSNSLYNQTKLLSDLDSVITARIQATNCLPTEHPHYAMSLNSLGDALQDRFQRTGSLSDLQEAIAAIQRAIRATPQAASERTEYLNSLSNVLQKRFERTREPNDLNEAIGISKEAVENTPKDGINKAKYLASLGNALQQRYKQKTSGYLDDLNHCVDARRATVECISSHDPNQAEYLNRLSGALVERFHRVNSIDDLNEAIAVMQKALNLPPNDDIDYINRAVYYFNLGNALQIRFEQGGSTNDLEYAILATMESVHLTPSTNPNYNRALNSLGLSLYLRYEETGAAQDLTKAKELLKEALVSIAEDDPGRAMHLSRFGNILLARCTSDELDEAVLKLEESIRSTSIDDHNYLTRLNILGTALQRRFEWAGSMPDLNRAIAMFSKAVDDTPKGSHLDRAIYLNNLGNCLRQRFGRTGAVEDIDDCVRVNQEAVDLTPQRFRNRAIYLNNLGNALNQRFYLSHVLSDIDGAVAAHEETVKSITSTHIYLASYLNSLAWALITRFGSTESLSDLNKAIIIGKHAVNCISTDDPLRAKYLNNFGYASCIRYLHTKLEEDRVAAIAACEEAASVLSAPPDIRILAARNAAQLLAGTDISKANELLKSAVQLLPTVSPRTLHRRDQQHALADFPGLGSTAAAICMEAEHNPFEALQLLEHGRGIMASLDLDVSADVAGLDPVIAENFKSLREDLSSPVQDPINVSWDIRSDNFANQIAQRNLSSKQLECFITSIRAMKGHERFLLCPSIDELKALTEHGPIVILNVSSTRSDAFLITGEGVRCLSLANLNVTDLKMMVKSFLKISGPVKGSNITEANKTLEKLLAWLWDVAVGPVLEALGFKEPPSPGTAWPHVWWISCGLLSLLPIHAAGYHKTSRNALDRVVSSYAPTIKALAHARGCARLARQTDEVLVVSMISTPNQSDLVHVADEVSSLKTIAPGACVLENPSKKKVLSKIQDCVIAHFACHGQSTLDDPSKSHLMLADWETESFSVADIVALKLTKPRFAYLSACHTANARVEELLDEGIHIAGACLLAGFSSVIGTLWRINDLCSAEISQDVYQAMSDNTGFEFEKAAEGLHNAVKRVREKARGHGPLLWAAYIHMGV